MTTKVTVEYQGYPVYVYAFALDDEQTGESTLVATLTEGKQEFYVHSHQDIMVTENKLDE